MKDSEKSKTTKNYFWRAVVVITAFSIGGIAVDSHYTHDDINKLQSQYEQILKDDSTDDMFSQSLEKRISFVEAEHHGEDVHTPGSICVCISNEITKDEKDFKPELCQYGDECDNAAELACEILHQGFNCEPAVR